MGIFYCDIKDNTSVTWSDLIADIKSTENYNKYCYNSNYYDIFKHIALSLILGEEIILIDYNLSSAEILNLTGYNCFQQFIKPIDLSKLSSIDSKDNLVSLFIEPPKTWSITLFTSGTTGIPKEVTHTYASIARFVKINPAKRFDIWGFAYNPTHIAGVQVFLQALFNSNTVIRLFGLTKDEIFESIRQYRITNISATPTFYRLLLPADEKFPSVSRVTFGGEKFDSQTTNQIRNLFPNAKLTNVYASTELGTLFASKDNVFSIKPDMQQFVKIVNNELVVHNSLMGNYDRKDGEWYHTGDIVKIISKKPLLFSFLSRKNEMINVGGYKINPNEVEDAIRKINGIQDVRVYSMPNSVLGNIICCELIKNVEELTETDIRKILRVQLQEYKIPLVMRFVEKIALTRTGKVKR